MHAVKPPDWEIKREIRPGTFRNYAHGYWRPLTLTIFTRRGVYTLIGKKRLARQWAAVSLTEPEAGE